MCVLGYRRVSCLDPCCFGGIAVVHGAPVLELRGLGWIGWTVRQAHEESSRDRWTGDSLYVGDADAIICIKHYVSFISQSAAGLMVGKRSSDL